MANIKSQIKRISVSEEERVANNSKRSRIKTAIKKYEAAIAANDVALATELFPITVSLIDAARLDGIFQSNTAARKKSRLAKLLNSIK